jgi:hypothetical protein
VTFQAPNVHNNPIVLMVSIMRRFDLELADCVWNSEGIPYKPRTPADPDSVHSPSPRFRVTRTIASTPALIASGRSVHASTMNRRSAGNADRATSYTGCTVVASRSVFWSVSGRRTSSFWCAWCRDGESSRSELRLTETA